MNVGETGCIEPVFKQKTKDYDDVIVVLGTTL